MKYLLDTCIIIDFLRGFPGAKEFFQHLDTAPVVSSITVAELYAGAKNSSKKKSVESFLDIIEVVEVSSEIAKKGGEWSCQYTPSHGIELPDALIAATAERESLNLATCNLKHFPMFPNLQRPY